eukprot:s690_g4.t1
MINRYCNLENSVKMVTNSYDLIRKRLHLLERKFATASFSVISIKTSDGGAPEGNSRPAIVIGGWDADQNAEETFRLVRDHIVRLDIDLDMDEAFVPGFRRRFVIILIHNKGGEQDTDFRRRIHDSLRRMREAKVVTGQRPQGGNRYCWAAMSESPGRHKRAQFAGKVKRLILEMDGDREILDMEFGTGNFWYGGQDPTPDPRCRAPRPDTIAITMESTPPRR